MKWWHHGLIALWFFFGCGALIFAAGDLLTGYASLWVACYFAGRMRAEIEDSLEETH